MLNKDFREFIASLNSNGVRYLVLGGAELQDLADLESSEVNKPSVLIRAGLDIAVSV